MSGVVSFAVRTAAINLLMWSTWAEERVIDSPRDPIAELFARVGPDPLPVIGVHVAGCEMEPFGRSFALAKTKMDLVIGIYLAPAGLRTPEGLELDTSNGGGGAALDFVSRQVMVALSTAEGPWGDLWNSLVAKFDAVSVQPLLYEVSESGLRIPAVEITVAMHTVPEPAIGEAPRGAWPRLLEVMRAESETAMLADTLEGLIIGKAGLLPSWRAFQATHGLSLAAVRASGLAPVDLTETGEAAELQKGKFDNTFNTATPAV